MIDVAQNRSAATGTDTPSMANRQPRQRREPSFGDSGGFDLRLSADDRPAGRSASPLSSGKCSNSFNEGSLGGSGGGRRGGGDGGRGSGKSPRKRQRRRRSVIGALAYWVFVMGLWGVIGIGGLVAYHASQLPPIDELTVPKRPPNIAILASDGSLLANRGDTGGRAVAIGELPKYLTDAFIAIEDRRFHSHFGVDPLGITRAIVRNFQKRGVTQGGSTLTQQLAKNLFLTQERTASRKIQEAILAIWLERNYSKDQILELYLNRVYFGAGAYGIEAAAQRYFGKSARAVNLAEAATLAGLVQAPSRLAPNRNPEASQARAQLVLAAMASEGMISDNAAKNALMKPAEAVRVAGAGSANYAADYVMDILDDVIGTIESDIVVTTTIDPNMQASAEASLVEELDAKGAKFNVGQGALVSMTPDGSIRALVGGRNYSENQFNRATAARRQPGSSFKPFVYLTALERGLTPDTIREDSPVAVRGWRPENFSRDYRGPMTLRDALATSSNTIAVKLGLEVGPKAVAQTAQRLGINSPMVGNASIALGTSEVSPLELVSAYAAFANGGIGVVPHIISKVQTVEGKNVFTWKPTSLGRVIDQQVVVQMNSMLRETLVTGTARKANFGNWEAAGKTGTSQEFRDAWFVGFTGRLVTGVWLGNDDSSPTKRVSGSNLPVEVWNRYMSAAHKGMPNTPLFGGPYERPQDVPVASADRGLADFFNGQPQRSAPVPRSTDNAWIPPQPRERGLLERLFGG